jgi:hypothetical protein
VRLFAPIISQPFVNPRGVGLPAGHRHTVDIDTLRAGWWYDWSCSIDDLADPRYVPMSWDGAACINLRRTYPGYLLVLNEPQSWGKMTAETGARLTLKLADWYPAARLIIGGCGYFEQEWFRQYVTILGDYRPAGWHVHGYIEHTSWAEVGLRDVIGHLRWCRDITKNQGEFWITEFADTWDGTHARELLDFVERADWIDRYAWFASRLTGGESYYPQNWQHNPALLGPDGKLTATGEAYTKG